MYTSDFVISDLKLIYPEGEASPWHLELNVTGSSLRARFVVLAGLLVAKSRLVGLTGSGLNGVSGTGFAAGCRQNMSEAIEGNAVMAGASSRTIEPTRAAEGERGIVGNENSSLLENVGKMVWIELRRKESTGDIVWRGKQS